MVDYHTANSGEIEGKRETYHIDLNQISCCTMRTTVERLKDQLANGKYSNYSRITQGRPILQLG
jgi:alpha-N-acetylglucosamine transferase